MTVDIYIAGRSEYRVRVNRIPTAEADVAFAAARSVLLELLKHVDHPHALRMELVDVEPIHESLTRG
ncbi:hypothetical protein [Achromobacter ruhlandii]|uniref:hypothetical protein n=1 Tax=Achromobacter ruhlandii TaxID=72557 RepID=UPI003018B30F